MTDRSTFVLERAAIALYRDDLLAYRTERGHHYTDRDIDAVVRMIDQADHEYAFWMTDGRFGADFQAAVRAGTYVLLADRIATGDTATPVRDELDLAAPTPEEAPVPATDPALATIDASHPDWDRFWSAVRETAERNNGMREYRILAAAMGVEPARETVEVRVEGIEVTVTVPLSAFYVEVEVDAGTDPSNREIERAVRDWVAENNAEIDTDNLGYSVDQSTIDIAIRDALTTGDYQFEEYDRTPVED